MSVAGEMKEILFKAARSTGLSRKVAHSSWRQNRLLILCYHSISIRDEHSWRPSLFMSRGRFVRRLEALRNGGYRVLPLGEALGLAQEGRLPPKAVSLTFDDGTAEFGRIVWPILKGYGFPATVYLTTYYAERRYAVFSVAIRYVLWKSGRSYPIPDTQGMNGQQLDDLGRHISDHVGFDWSELARTGMFHIMPPDQVRRVSDEGCSIQLHTHRHRSPPDEHLYRSEVSENRARIQEWTGTKPVHFCYPSGVYRPEFVEWLRREGVRTAVTTDPGMVTRNAEPFLLHRFVDTMQVSDAKFDAWLAGTAELLPRRRRRNPLQGSQRFTSEG